MEYMHRDGRTCVRRDDPEYPDTLWWSKRLTDEYDEMGFHSDWYAGQEGDGLEGPMPEFMWVPCGRTHEPLLHEPAHDATRRMFEHLEAEERL